MTSVGDFLGKLRTTKEGEGGETLLDRTMVLCGSAMGNANDHTHHPLPLVVLGGGSGQVTKGGHHIASPNLTPMANLLLALSQKMGVETGKFGLSTEAMDI